MSDERTIQCTGTARVGGEPVKFSVRVCTGSGTASVYVLSLNEAVALRRELTDFLSMQNVPAYF
jgi:hypothetical protein